MQRSTALAAILGRTLVRLLNYGSALFLLCMVALTCADVMGRYFFNAPIFGALELTEILLAAVIFFGLPLVSLRTEHITVDIFDCFLGNSAQRVLVVIGNMAGSVFSAFICWQLWCRAQGMLSSGEVTGQLGIKLGWLTLLMAVTMGLTCLAFIAASSKAGRSVDENMSGSWS